MIFVDDKYPLTKAILNIYDKIYDTNVSPVNVAVAIVQTLYSTTS